MNPRIELSGKGTTLETVRRSTVTKDQGGRSDYKVQYRMYSSILVKLSLMIL